MLDGKSLFQKLRDLEAKATPGPWKIELGTLGEEERVYGIYSGKYSFDRIIETDTGFYPPRRPDADLIVEYRNAIPKLLAVIDVYEMAMEQVEDCCPNNGEIAAICAETLKRVEELGENS